MSNCINERIYDPYSHLLKETNEMNIIIMRYIKEIKKLQIKKQNDNNISKIIVDKLGQLLSIANYYEILAQYISNNRKLPNSMKNIQCDNSIVDIILIKYLLKDVTQCIEMLTTSSILIDNENDNEKILIIRVNNIAKIAIEIQKDINNRTLT